MDNFGITPYDAPLDVTTAHGFTEINLGEGEKMRVASLLHELPAVATNSALSNLYTVSFPEGVSGSLMQYANGGVGSPIMGENGIIDHASFHQVSPVTSLALGCFTAMSIATSQYFLTQINNREI